MTKFCSKCGRITTLTTDGAYYCLNCNHLEYPIINYTFRTGTSVEEE